MADLGVTKWWILSSLRLSHSLTGLRLNRCDLLRQVTESPEPYMLEVSSTEHRGQARESLTVTGLTLILGKITYSVSF